MNPERISFITFTRDSAPRIKGLMEDVKDVVDEIIVIDGYSKDDTVGIAERYGARVWKRRPWGYADPDRMFALRKASYEWVLYLDDDERLGKKLKSELKDLVAGARDRNIDAFSTTRIDFDGGSLILGPFYTKQTRLYRKSKVRYKGLVHELPIVNGVTEELPDVYYILHRQEKWDWNKSLHYARLEALEYSSKYGHEKSRSLIRPMLWRLAPISVIPLYLYNLSVGRKHLNASTLLPAFRWTLYESIKRMLMNIRNKDEIARAKMIEEKGLIQLLGLDTD